MANPKIKKQIKKAKNSGMSMIELARINVAMNATAITSTNIDSSHRVPISLSSNVKTPEITTVDGSALKFMVINEGESLPSAIPDTTLIVLIAKN